MQPIMLPLQLSFQKNANQDLNGYVWTINRNGKQNAISYNSNTKSNQINTKSIVASHIPTATTEPHNLTYDNSILHTHKKLLNNKLLSTITKSTMFAVISLLMILLGYYAIFHIVSNQMQIQPRNCIPRAMPQMIMSQMYQNNMRYQMHQNIKYITHPCTTNEYTEIIILIRLNKINKNGYNSAQLGEVYSPNEVNKIHKNENTYAELYELGTQHKFVMIVLN